MVVQIRSRIAFVAPSGGITRLLSPERQVARSLVGGSSSESATGMQVSRGTLPANPSR